MSPEYLATIKAKPHGPDVDKLIAEIERLTERERELLIGCARCRGIATANIRSADKEKATVEM